MSPNLIILVSVIFKHKLCTACFFKDVGTMSEIHIETICKKLKLQIPLILLEMGQF